VNTTNTTLKKIKIIKFKVAISLLSSISNTVDERLTIILALKGRHQFTERWLNFANKNLNKFKIFIADGSDIGCNYNLDSKKFPNLDLQQKIFSPDLEISDFIKKLNISSQTVSSRYILYADNDDFLNENELINSLNFLDINKAYSAARGEIFDFSVDSYNEIYGNIIGLKPFIESLSFEKENTFDRFYEFAINRQGLLHCIVRKDIFSEILRISIENKFFDLSTFLLFYNYYLTISGKIFCSNNLFMLHQNHKFMLSKNNELMSVKNSGFMSKKLTDNFLKIISNKIFNNKIDNYEKENKIRDIFYRNFILEKLVHYENIESQKGFKLKILDLVKNSLIFNLYLKAKNLVKNKKSNLFEKDVNYKKIKLFLKKN
jgi:glycosyltransferase domain-containing protein